MNLYGLVILMMTVMGDVQEKSFNASIKAVGTYSSKLECEGVAARLQAGLLKGHTAVCGALAR